MDIKTNMARQLTKKQKAFADKYLETGNATKAALETYDTEDYKTANNIGSENLAKPSIRAYFEDHSQDAANEIYRLGQKAKNETVRLGANKDILDRAGYKPVDKVEHSGNFTLENLFTNAKSESN